MQLTLNLENYRTIFDCELHKVRYQDKEDVRQTAILRILTTFANYDSEQIPENKLAAFVRTIVRRTIADYYRKRGRLIEQSSFLANWNDYAGEPGNEVSCTSTNAFYYGIQEYGYDLVDVRTDYLNNVDQFTPSERRFVEFVLFNEDAAGMKVSEIYTALGINKTHAARAFKKLREICEIRV